MSRLAVVPLFALMFTLSVNALAHPLAPVAVRVEERGDAEALVVVKRSRVQPKGAALSVRLPPDCRELSPPVLDEKREHVQATHRLRCEGGLIGKRFGVNGLSEAELDAIVEVRFADGRSELGLLDRTDDVFEVPAPRAWTSTARTFVGRGFEHLLGGFDHVLFVVGLVLLVRRPREVLLALTAFTLGHAASMCAAVMGVVSIPGAAAETAIAATLVWLAWRVVQRAEDRAAPASGRRLYLACVGVGLVHGLGFATAFAEAGATGTRLAVSLSSFHAGIEAGQLVVAVALVALARLGSRVPERFACTAPRLAGYGMGSLAVMWMLERGVMLFA